MQLFNTLINLEVLEIEIKYTDYGIGNNFGEVIELNRNLLYYPKLYKAVLNHELSHTNNSFTLKDLKLDLVQNVNSLEMLKFMLKYPKSFTQLLPFYYSRKHGFVYDINLILIYLSALGLFSLVTFLALSI